MLSDYFKLALNNILRRKVRTFLTVLGILIGIAAVVSLVSLGEGFSNSVDQQFNMIGADKLIISSNNRLSSFTNPFTTDYITKIEKVSGVSRVSYIIAGIDPVTYKNTSQNVFIAAYPLDSSRRIIESMNNLKINNGRELKEHNDYDVVVGCDYPKSDNIFSHSINLGNKLEIGNNQYTIVGVMDCIGDRLDDTSVMMTLPSVRGILGLPDQVSTIVVQVADKNDMDAVANRIKKLLFHLRNQNNNTKDFTIQTPQEMLKQFNEVFSIVQLVVLGIAAISLLVGIVGIMNTMYTSVIERTSEIGIMKAIGARNGSILLIFLFESGIIGLIGGVLGVSLGFAMSKTIEILLVSSGGTSLLTPVFSPLLIFGSFGLSFLFGIIGGILPARQAAMLKPVDAIRS